MYSRVFIAVVSGLWFTSCIYLPQHSKSQPLPVKRTVYHEVALEEMIRRSISKTHDPNSPTIEGIYAVSVVISKKGRSFIFPSDKERVVLRKDNYAKVAILKDWPESKNEFVELSISNKNPLKYPIVGEINRLAEGGGFIYRHIEPKGEEFTFTFLYDEGRPDILEGIYATAKNGIEYTYKLTYVKVWPKASGRSSEID